LAYFILFHFPGVYSVRIGESKFKVAQITISNEQQLSGSGGGGSTGRIKRISSQSLNKLEEKPTTATSTSAAIEEGEKKKKKEKGTADKKK
jgi:hypothetical protein